MFEIVFLGTSASAPSIRRGLSSAMVLHNEHRFMIDCGEGTQRQLLQSGLGFKRLDKILLTHGHLDHILGLAGLLSTLMRWETLEEFEIYGGRAALDRVEDLIYKIVLRDARTAVKLHFNDVKPGKIFADKSFEVSAFPVTHRGSGNFGYLFGEKAHRPFLADKAEALGVPFGPERKLLVAGQPIKLADGRVIQPDDVLGDLIEGAALPVVGDAAPQKGLYRAFGREITEPLLSRDPFGMYFRKEIGILFQNPDAQLFNPTVEDEIAFGPLQMNDPPDAVRAKVRIAQAGASNVGSAIDAAWITSQPTTR